MVSRNTQKVFQTFDTSFHISFILNTWFFFNLGHFLSLEIKNSKEYSNPAHRNLERTKRDLRAAYGLIDRFLETVAPTENLSTFGDLVGAADCVVFPEANT